jgi:hypothetical protein
MTLLARARRRLAVLAALVSVGLSASCSGERAQPMAAPKAAAREGSAVTFSDGSVRSEAPALASPSAPPPTARPEARVAMAETEGAPADRREDGAPPSRRRDLQAGLLTAAVWDDFTPEHWSGYQEFLRRYEQEPWGDDRIELRAAVQLRLLNEGSPLANHPVVVRQGQASWRLTTLADGSLRLFPGAFHGPQPGPITIAPEGGVAETVDLADGEGGIVEVSRSVDRLPKAAPGPPRLDLGFLIDATGSMQDEMTYLQTELRDIIRRVAPQGSDLKVRIAVVYYRDRGDDFVTKVSRFTTDIDATTGFLEATRADGGGDFPEDMNAGLREMMNLGWSPSGQAARMLVVLADAPPHPYPDAPYTYRDALVDAGGRGIAIFPIAASGVDKATEHLFRGFAASTGGKYIFLTDDSGIGNPHLKPDIQGYEVEPLNRLLVREIRAFAAGYYPQFEQATPRP